MEYIVRFQGGSTQSSEFKNQLVNYLRNNTLTFDFNGRVLKFQGDKHDYDELFKFVQRHSGTIIIQ